MPVAALRLLVLPDLRLDYQPLVVVVDGPHINGDADVAVLCVPSEPDVGAIPDFPSTTP